MGMNKTMGWVALVTGALLLGVAARAHAGGSFAGATEFTQVLNNAELVASVAKQAQMVSEQINTRLVQLQQFSTMTRNLEHLGRTGIDQALEPYRLQQQQLRGYQDLLTAVTALQDASTTAGGVLNSRSLEFARSGLKDPAKYIAYELGLAKRRGGVYQKRLQQDLGALDALQARNAEFRRVASQTADITGNLQGLQQLSQLSAMATGELMELKAAVIAQNVDSSVDKRSAQNNAGFRTGVYESTRGTADGRAPTPEPKGIGADPMKSWERTFPGQ